MSKHSTIYLNHAGTSWPKPAPVVEATASVFNMDPTQWASAFHAAHETVAKFFHIDSARLLLTPSCTTALNLAVMDHDWTHGDCVVTSHYEHHALHRSIVKLAEFGVTTRVLPRTGSDLIDLEALEAELRTGKVKLVACTAACNVTGQLLPISEAIDLAHRYGTRILIDGAQIAGWYDLDLEELGADLFTFAGHKGPQAPWGIGGLYVSPGVAMTCPLATCERPTAPTSASMSEMPGYCDAGSVNLSALLGLAAGCSWLRQPERANRLTHAQTLARKFAESVRELPNVQIHHDVVSEKKTPTVAITVGDESATTLAKQLQTHGLMASGGFQCAPHAHRALGTDQSGVVRFSFGMTNHETEVTEAVELLNSIR